MKGARHEADFAHSMTDLMSGVAVLFLLIAAIFMVQATKEKRRAQRAEEEATRSARRNAKDAAELEHLRSRDDDGIQQLADLRDKLLGNARLAQAIELDYDPVKDPRLLTIVFSRDNLRFASGACDVDEPRRLALQHTLHEIFPAVCGAVAGREMTITLEGHTDASAPYGGRCGTDSSDEATCSKAPSAPRCTRRSFENNVRLSSARAQFVLFEARAALAHEPAVSACLDKNFIAAGRGPVDPIDGRPWHARRTEAENARNRRVVIRVRVMAPTVARPAPDGTATPPRPPPAAGTP